MDFKNWILSEVNWETDPSEYGFSDVSKTCMDIDQVVDGLNKILDRYELSKKDRADSPFPRSAEFAPKKQLVPQFSAGNLYGIVGDKGRFTQQTVMEFIEEITKPPKTIFDEGEKSKHTNELDLNVFTVNTGITALRAIVYDKNENKFYSVNTCKGAGSCIVGCYALKGFYVMNDGKNIKLQQRLNLLVNDPNEYYRRALSELRAVALREIPQGKSLRIRWNDAGDWFSKTYYNIAVKITKQLKNIKIDSINDLEQENLFGSSPKSRKKIDFRDKILSYGYTKQSEFIDLAKKHGIVMNFSMGAKPDEISKVNLNKTKISVTVPYFVFEGVFARKERGEPMKFKPGMDKEILRQKVIRWAVENNYIKPKEKVVFTDEIVNIPEKRPFWQGGAKYHVIVLPKDADISAYRHDVHYTFLLEH